MRYLLRIFLFICVLMQSNVTHARGVNNQDVLIDSVMSLIQKHNYVDAYFVIKDKEELLTKDNSKYISDILKSKILKAAYLETNESYYLNEYIKTISNLCHYFLLSDSLMKLEHTEPLWRYTKELAQFYWNTKDTSIEKLIKAINKNQVALNSNIYSIFYQFYTYELEKGNYTLGSMELDTYLLHLPIEYSHSSHYARVMHLSGFTQLINVKTLKKGEFYTKEILHKLDTAYKLYKQNNSEKINAIRLLHLYGDYAILNFYLNNQKKAHKYLKKEEYGIIRGCGKESLEYAWYLFHRAYLQILANNPDDAKDALVQALNLYHSLSPNYKDSHRYILIRKHYKSLAIFGESVIHTTAQHSIYYYQTRLEKIPSELNKTNSKLEELTEIQLQLGMQNPIPLDEYVKCISLIAQLAINDYDANKELVMIPNDFHVFYQNLSAKLSQSDEFLNSLLVGGNLSTSKMSIIGGIALLQQRHMLRKDLLIKLMDLYAELSLLEKNWKEARKALYLSLSIGNPLEKDDTKKAARLCRIAFCFLKEGKKDSCQAVMSKTEKFLYPTIRDREQTTTMCKAYATGCDIYDELGNHKKANQYADITRALAKLSFKTLPYFYSSTYRKALTLYEDGNFKDCSELLLPIYHSNQRQKDTDKYFSILIRSLCKIKDQRAVDVLGDYMEHATQKLIPSYFTSKSLFERDSLWSLTSSNLVLLNTQVALTFPSESIRRNAYDNILFIKSLDMEFNQLLKESVRNGDSFIKRVYQQMLVSQDSLNFGSKEQLLKHKNNIAFAQQILPAAMTQECLRQLSKRKFFNSLRSINLGTAIVEFVTCRHDDEPTYYAYITQHNDKAPLLIKIATNKELTNLYNNNPATINKLYIKNKYLYNHIWKKIDKQLHKGTKHIVIVPSGVLNRINFNAIPTDYGMLADSFQIIRVAHPSTLTYRHARRHRNKSMDVALFGDIKYDLAKEEIIHESLIHPNNIQSGHRRPGNDRGYLAPLGFARIELSRIQEAFKGSNLKLKSFTGENASEGAFKQLSGNAPRIIHLTTHGFYLQDDKLKHAYYNKTKYLNYREQSLLYHGVLMAGAQYAWNGNSLPNGVEDGILTADEISRMDLSATELVVLSACETALGDIDDTEGVLGLQRAFKKAGVKFVLMSLWPVRDDSTAFFMINFYRNIQTEKNIAIAIKKAMKTTAKRFPNPSDWAGFILLR